MSTQNSISIRSTTRETFANDGAARHIECGKQHCGSVTFVIMGYCSGATLLQGQTRLGAVKRLDLGFLVDGKRQRLLWRIDVEADNLRLWRRTRDRWRP